MMFNEELRRKIQQRSLIALCISICIFTWRGVSLGAPVADLRTLLPKQDLPAGWTLVEGPHVYSKKTLFEHVDGQAVLYLSYGFQRSVFAVFQNVKEPKNQIEVDIYDVGSGLNAFGVFSRFRNDNRPGGVGLDSYLDDRSLLFYKGRYFVMLYATETDASALKQLAMTISAKIVDSSPPPREIDLFPKNGLKTGSIQYFPEGLLGHTFLGRGFQASYVDEGETTPQAQAREPLLFLALFKSPQAAKEALTTYKSYISKQGKLLPWTPVTFGTDAWKGEDPYQGPLIVVQKGLHLIGVRGFPEKKGELYLQNFMKKFR
jgi:hypothetical protein